jgi:hypothetical protein
VSRMRENLTSGSMGGRWKRSRPTYGDGPSPQWETLGSRQPGLPVTRPPRQRSTLLRTGNAARRSIQVDRYVVSRLHRFLVRRQGRHLRPGQAERWTADWLHGLGLHRLRGTIRYPETA